MRKVFFFLMACALTVSSAMAETFNKVTDVSQLKDGARLVLACETKGVVSGDFDLNSNNKPIQIKAVTATIAGGKVELEGPVMITMKANGDNWNLYIGSKPIGHDASDANSVDLKSGVTTDFGISFDANGNAIIKSQTGKNSKFPQFYSNTNSGKFRLYNTSTQNMIQIYVLDESTVEEQKPTSVALSQNALEMRLGDEPVALTATVEPSEAVDKSVVWGSLNEAVATVADGAVTAVALGTTKVWVRTNTAEKTDTCVVTVLPALNHTTANYKIVQKADYLPEDAKVFFGTLKDGENNVMARYESGNNIKCGEATYGEAHHSVEAELQFAYTVKRDGEYFVFVDQDGYYLRTLSSSKLGKGTELDDYAKWTLGEFDADDATVDLVNKGCSKYLYYNSGSDLFNIYDKKTTWSGFTRVVLFSSEAQDWVEREKNPSMSVDVTTLDWGEIEAEGGAWGSSYKSFVLTFVDLSDDIEISLESGTVFELPLSGDVISKDHTSPMTYNVFFEPAAAGEYSDKLTIHTETVGVDDIVIELVAKAVVEGGGSGSTPEFTLSTNAITLNPNNDNGYDDIASFSFTAKNLQKNLYCKWEHTSDVLFQYAYQNPAVEILLGADYIALNGSKTLTPDQDYDIETLVEVSRTDELGIEEGTYTTKLHFYSPSVADKNVNVIDEYVTITIIASIDPVPTAIETLDANASAQKLLRDGQIVIIRNGVVYGIDGKQL